VGCNPAHTHAPLPSDDPGAILAAFTHNSGNRTLYTPQQLFDEFGSSADVLAHAPFLERARLERERCREYPARLALGAYVVARLVDRLLSGLEGVEAQEGFAWQLAAVRRHLADLPGDAPETAHLRGIADAVPANPAPTPALRLCLTAYAYFLEHEARLEEALDILGLASRSHGAAVPPPEFAAIALFAGRLNRLLARWAAANTCYERAEEAARSAGDAVTALRSRLGRCAVLRGQGNLPLAKASTQAVVEEASRLGLREVQAMAYADLGSVCANQGLHEEAVQANYQAFLLSEDQLQRMRVLGDLGICLLGVGARETARLAFEIVTESNTSFMVRTNAVLELMDLESTVGNRMAFERRRAQAEEARDRMPPSMAADFQFKAGVGMARFGRFKRAKEFLGEGLRLAEELRLNLWYFKFEKELNELEAVAANANLEAREPDLATPATYVESPVIEEVTVGLREYSLSAS
jgi:tetratricopeptide (TPR) repeat protein